MKTMKFGSFLPIALCVASLSACNSIGIELSIRPVKLSYDGVVYSSFSENKECQVTGFNDSISTDVSILSSITSYGVTYTVNTIASNAFANCSQVQKVHIPSSVTTIESQAFWNAQNLSTVEFIGDDLIIKDQAFGCYAFAPSSLTVICYTDVPPILEDNSFSNYEASIQVLVPPIALDKYKHTEGWNRFPIQPM